MVYSFGYDEAIFDSNEELNISIWLCTDIPVWYFRIYNALWYTNATKMARVLFTKPLIMNLMEPCTWFDIGKDLDLVKLDKFIGSLWQDLIASYNFDSCNEPYPIPEDLVKPDYTKLKITDNILEYYYGI